MTTISQRVAEARTVLAETRKFVITVIGVVGQLIALGVLHGDALHWATVILAVLTAATVYRVPNQVKAALAVVVPPA